MASAKGCLSALENVRGGVVVEEEKESSDVKTVEIVEANGYAKRIFRNSVIRKGLTLNSHVINMLSNHSYCILI